MNEIGKRHFGKTYFYLCCIISFVIPASIAYLLPEDFSEYRNTDTFAPFWFFITNTGGVYGASAIILFLMIYLMHQFKDNKSERKKLFIFILSIFCVQIIITASTLYYFKDVFQSPRPSQLYIIGKGSIEDKGKEFYAMPLEEKSKYLRKQIDDNRNNFDDVYPPILDSWIYESGFSFPSGHSQTAFFLGTILAFVFYKTNPYKFYFTIPLIWAILVALSRVLIGVHFPLDVTVGAFIGLAMGFLVISLTKINKAFTKTSN